MNKFGIFIFLLQLVRVLSKEVVSYKGYCVYKVLEKGKTPKLKIPNSKKDIVSVLTEHHQYDDENNPFTVRSYLIPQKSEKDFRKILDRVGAKYNVSVRDLDKDIEEERRSFAASNRRTGPGDWNITSQYFSHEEMVEFLKDIGKIKNPLNGDPLAIVEPIGKSLEGREMHLVKISTDHNAQKPVIFIEAGIHAREWTAPSTALYAIHQLVVNHTHTARILDDIDFYIIPLSNPDGYEYSRAADRLWRKTRSFHKGHYGVDGNRNFGFHWGEGGASSSPSSEIFKGPYPFSEPETRNIRDVGTKYKDRIHAFVALHAYGPYILYPWSYRAKAPAPHTDDMDRVAKAAAKAIEAYSGTQYNCGASNILLYEAAGGSDDYFKGALGVDLCFTFELSSADRGSFVIPTNRIHRIASEAFVGFKVISEHGARYKKSERRTGFSFGFR